MKSSIMQTIKRIKAFANETGHSLVYTPALLIDYKVVQAATGFELGALKALSLSIQRHMLKKARDCLKHGLPKLANYWLKCWQRERAFFNQINSI